MSVVLFFVGAKAIAGQLSDGFGIYDLNCPINPIGFGGDAGVAKVR